MICVYAEVFWRKMIVTFEYNHASFSAIPMSLEG